MNNTIRLALFLMILLFISCEKDPVVVNFDDRRGNLIGEWEVTESSPINSDFTFALILNEDGTGTQGSSLGTEVPINWLYQFNPEKVVIETVQSGLFLSNTQFYDVIKNEPTEQTWTFESEFIAIGPLGSTITWSMKLE